MLDMSKVVTSGARRLEAMETINQQRIDQLQKDNEHIKLAEEPPVEKLPEENKAESAADTESSNTSTSQDQINRAFIDDEENTFVKIKVNGVEQEVSIAEMRRDAQKVRAANERFEQAARIKREAEDLVKKVKENPPASADSNNDDAGEGNDKLPVEMTAAVKKVVDTIYGGNEEEAVAALTELLSQTGRGSSTTQSEQPIELDDVVAKVTDNIERKNALDRFKSEYQDVWKNPALATVADQFLATKLGEGMPFGEALTAAGDEVRDMVTKAAQSMGYVKTTEKTEQTPPANSKEERKKAIDNPPSSGDSASTTVAKEEPQTISTVIAEMAKNRGAHRHYQ